MTQTKALTNEGRRRLRDALIGDVGELAAGSDGSSASSSDTDVGDEVIAKSTEGTADATGVALFTARLLTDDAVGETLRELAPRTSGGAALARLVHAEKQKTEGLEIEYRLRARVRGA